MAPEVITPLKLLRSTPLGKAGSTLQNAAEIICAWAEEHPDAWAAFSWLYEAGATSENIIGLLWDKINKDTGNALSNQIPEGRYTSFPIVAGYVYGMFEEVQMIQSADDIEITRLPCGCINVNGQGHLPYNGEPCALTREEPDE